MALVELEKAGVLKFLISQVYIMLNIVENNQFNLSLHSHFLIFQESDVHLESSFLFVGLIAA